MAVSWSIDQVLALAPDASSAKSGKDLAAPRKWSLLGASDVCVWGEIQGSGKDPYRTCIDPGEPAFKCTCPSRKFPCKHSLGLFLILSQQPGALTDKEPPPWAAEWLAKRAQKAEKKAAQAAAPAEPPDPEAAAKAAAAAEKRAVAREAKVAAGLEDLEVWLRDLVRSGFAALPGKTSGFWETPAARLVDAQAPGLARRVRELDGITATGDRWPTRLLERLALIHLACEAWPRMNALAPTTQADLRAVIGFTEKQDDILAQAAVRDRWLVLGQRVEEEDRLRVQRTWLCGAQTRRSALCLTFAAANQPLDTSLVPGTVIDADLAFFPSACPLRVLVKERHGDPSQLQPETAAFPHATVAEAVAFAAESFIANPWLEQVPFGLSGVTPLWLDESWLARDSAGQALPLNVTDEQGWRLAAVAGGHPVALAGEWDGESLRPLSVWAEGRFSQVARRQIQS
jgi:hypothetical protein